MTKRAQLSVLVLESIDNSAARRELGVQRWGGGAGGSGSCIAGDAATSPSSFSVNVLALALLNLAER